MRIIRFFHNQKGFSLIEMLVVTAIAGLVFATIFWSMNFQKIAAEKQTNLSDIYENQRFALEIMTRYIRLGGLNMNQPRVFNLDDPSAAAPPYVIDFRISSTNNVETPERQGTDELIIRYAMDLQAGKCGTITSGGKTYNAPCNLGFTQTSTSPPGAVPSPQDTFYFTDGTQQVYSDAGEVYSATIEEIVTAWAASPLLAQTDPPIKGMLVDPDLLYNNMGSILSFTSMPPPSDSWVTLNNALTPPFTYSDGGTFSIVEWNEIKFYVEYDPAVCQDCDRHPRLMMSFPSGATIPIATDVEDLQFAFANDSDADGNIDDLNGNGILDDNDFTNEIVTSTLNFDYVRIIRISMCFRSREWVTKDLVGFRPPIEDHAPGGGATGDGYARKTISTKVNIRNMSTSFSLY